MSDIDFKIFIVDLINQQENEFVDFKEKHHVCHVDLVHDILCLANAEGKKNRYIIYGVTDGNKDIVGIEKNCKNRKEADDFITILSGSKCNRPPDVSFKSITLNQKLVDILIIKNKPYKPYFLLEDKKRKEQQDGGTKSRKSPVRSGVVYTRIAGTNTPITETASELAIQNMWEERFGLKLSPLERIKKYIEDTLGWRKTTTGAYYAKFPEFTLEYKDEMEPSPIFFERWHAIVPHPHNLGTRNFFLKYHSTCLLENQALINVEYKRLFPTPTFPSATKAAPIGIILKSSLNSKVAAILDTSNYHHEGINFEDYWDSLRFFLQSNSEEFKIELIDDSDSQPPIL